MTPQIAHELLDFAIIELALATHDPAFLFGLVAGIQSMGCIPEVLPSVIKVDDLNGTGKVTLSNIPDVISCAASCWVASAGFFLWCEGILQRAGCAKTAASPFCRAGRQQA